LIPGRRLTSSLGCTTRAVALSFCTLVALVIGALAQSPPAARLANISARLAVGTDSNVLIGGFIITGTQPKKVLLRGLGPSLPVSENLADPTLELHDSSGGIVAANDNWRDIQQDELQATTIPPSSDYEPAIVASLNPGAYTAVLAGKGRTTGVGLVEIYDLDQTVDSKLANISTRGFVGQGDNILIGGTIVIGNCFHKRSLSRYRSKPAGCRECVARSNAGAA
jgi:hypothetical protein